MRHLAAAFLALFAVACSKAPTAIPKPEADPRANIPEATYTRHEYKGVDMLLNTRASIDTAENGITLMYTHPDARVYITVLRDVDGIDQIRRQRFERMYLNVATDNVTADTMASRGGFGGIMVTANTATQTPVQMYAEGADRRSAIFATAFLNTTATPANLDSLAPYIDALKADVMTLSRSLEIK